jgi:hypothetical protein
MVDLPSKPGRAGDDRALRRRRTVIVRSRPAVIGDGM